MLNIILLTVCSTCLVRIWFWKKVYETKRQFFKNFKKCFKDSNETKKIIWTDKLILQSMCSIGFSFLLVIIFFCKLCYRQNFYGLWIAIILCLIIQFSFFPSRKIVNCIVVLAIMVILVLGVQDTIAKKNVTIELNKVQSITLATYTNQSDFIKIPISSEEIRSLFKVDSTIGPTYNNGRFVYIVDGGDTGNGIVVIDKDNYNEAKFLPCSYEFHVSNIYYQYYKKLIKKLYIAISNENIPYGLFAVAEKDWLLGTYNVNIYVMLNLFTGEIQEFTLEQLPDFVRYN